MKRKRYMRAALAKIKAGTPEQPLWAYSPGADPKGPALRPKRGVNELSGLSRHCHCAAGDSSTQGCCEWR
jgi:hypothetical protein